MKIFLIHNIDFEENDLDRSTSEGQSEERKQRKYLNWQLVKKYNNEQGAIAYIKLEKVWAKHNTNKTSDAEKIYYQCTHKK